MQRGIYDTFWRDITWEDLRESVYSKSAYLQSGRESSSSWEKMIERVYITPEKVRFARRPSSWIDQLTHSLRMRRTRASDRRDKTDALRRPEAS